MRSFISRTTLGVAFALGALFNSPDSFAIDCPPCDDGNICTTDFCDTTSGICQHGNPCDDHNVCSIDFCTPGGSGFTCFNDWTVREGLPCNDDDPCAQGTGRCHLGVCQGGTLYVDFICSDSNACTGTDLCASSVCSSGPQANCDDGNPCTSDTCDVLLGCRHTPNTNACDDGQACTMGDACLNGACVGTRVCACEDADSDGFLDCTVPGCEGGVLPCGDCDDHDGSIRPGATEACNQRDDDCDGRADDGSAIAWFTRRVTASDPAPDGRFGSGVRQVGDTTGDGIPELASLANGPLVILSGADGTEICRVTGAGGAFDALGDITGDGISDLVTGGASKVLFISGADCSIIKSCTDSWWYIDNLGEFPLIRQIYRGFGSNLVAVGDLDGDAIPDVVVGDPLADPNPRFGTPGAGAAVLMSGSNCRVIARTAGGALDRLSHAMAPVGDLNGDRVPDIAVGAPQFNKSSGYVRLVSGANGATIRTLQGFRAGGAFGELVSGGDDLNADGIADIVSGESAGATNPVTHTITVHSGATGGLLRRCIDPQGENVGGLLVGDMTGDGISDIAGGVPTRDTPQGVDAGEIEIFSGADCSTFRHLQDREGGEAGASLGTPWPAGDLNHDGWPDLVVGVPGDDVGGITDAGSILYFISEPDCDGDGIGVQGGDCDDADPAAAPGRPETCDGRDNDCNGVVDEGTGLADTDADGRNDCLDNCPADPNPDQADSDTDGIGDACDTCPDADRDGACCGADNCCDAPNADQADLDADGLGDACDACPADADNDADLDQVCGDADNCPAASNADQRDADADGSGDPCDPCPLDADDDIDGDGRCADADNCPLNADPDQADADLDGFGDVCDNCPGASNPDQNPCACGACFPLDITLSLRSSAGRGSGLLSWRTGLEHDIAGFNIVSLDARGSRTQLNPALIACVECDTDLGHDYAFLIPRHKSGRTLYVEQLGMDGSRTLYGPATRNVRPIPIADR